MSNRRRSDDQLIESVRAEIRKALGVAENRVKVAKGIAVEATRQRNRGREPAKSRHPFRGICEASGAPLDEQDAVLDELEPKKGYAGRVRWVCPKANNSGKRSCGVC